jgi:hypothetical protein
MFAAMAVTPLLPLSVIVLVVGVPLIALVWPFAAR